MTGCTDDGETTLGLREKQDVTMKGTCVAYIRSGGFINSNQRTNPSPSSAGPGAVGYS